MFNLKRILITTILCGFLSVVGLSFDVYAEGGDPPEQDHYQECVKKVLIEYGVTTETIDAGTITNIVGDFKDACWSDQQGGSDEAIARRLIEKDYSYLVPAHDTNGNRLEKEVIEAANGAEYQDCLERAASDSSIECKQGAMSEDVPNTGYGYPDLYNGGNYSKIRTDRFGSFFYTLLQQYV
jgi:hypothetical protein